MRKFNFRLGSLENIKAQELDEMRLKLAEVQGELRRAERDLLNTREALAATYEELADLRQRRTEPLLLLSLESYTSVLRGQQAAQAERVAKQKRELAEARERLAEKHKEKKVLEKYRERQFAKHAAQAQREEQLELDETAKNLHARQESTTPPAP